MPRLWDLWKLDLDIYTIYWHGLFRIICTQTKKIFFFFSLSMQVCLYTYQRVIAPIYVLRSAGFNPFCLIHSIRVYLSHNNEFLIYALYLFSFVLSHCIFWTIQMWHRIFHPCLFLFSAQWPNNAHQLFLFLFPPFPSLPHILFSLHYLFDLTALPLIHFKSHRVESSKLEHVSNCPPNDI